MRLYLGSAGMSGSRSELRKYILRVGQRAVKPAVPGVVRRWICIRSPHKRKTRSRCGFFVGGRFVPFSRKAWPPRIASWQLRSRMAAGSRQAGLLHHFGRIVFDNLFNAFADREALEAENVRAG